MYKLSSNSNIEYLNSLAARAAKNKDDGIGVLSTGEFLYVALASNRLDLLETRGYTIAEALSRIGNEWIAHLIYCWQYAGDPKKWEEG